MLMSLKRYFLLLVIFFSVFIYGLIVFLPISVVAREIERNVPGASIGESSGRLWQGHFNDVSWEEFNHGTLSWQLHLLALLEGDIEVTLKFSQKTISASTKLTIPFNHLLTLKEIELTGTKATFNIEQLTPFAPYPLPSVTGELNVFLEHLALDLKTISYSRPNIPIVKLESPVLFSTSHVKVLDEIDIGEYSGKIMNTKNLLGYKITLESISGALGVSGHSVLLNQQIKSEYLVNPSAKIDLQLTQLLDLMGQKRPDGSYSFNTDYAL